MSLIEQIILDEGLELKPYACTAGKLTIGVGRNLEDVGITESEAMFLLGNDIARVEDELKQFPWYALLNEVRKDAMINMCFNLGINRFKGFKRMIVALESSDYTTAAIEMLDSKWARQVKGRAVRLADEVRDGI